MTCFRPINAWQYWDKVEGKTAITFKQPKEYCAGIKLPCGKCIGCILDKANDWSTRCWCEAKEWNNNCFITLTYNDENLPKNRLLCKKDLQDFWKRLRYYENGIENWTNPRTQKNEKPIRYFACGEYGSKNKRPHYHAIVFNWKPKDLKFYKENHAGDRLFISKKLTKIWGKGFVIVGNVTYKSACYVARYTTKKMFNVKKSDLKKGGIESEFILMSRNGGIGINYWNTNKRMIINNEGILIKIGERVKNRRIPKYFETLYQKQDEYHYEFYKEKKIQRGLQSWKDTLKKTTLSESEYLRLMENNLLEKAKLLKRDNII